MTGNNNFIEMFMAETPEARRLFLRVLALGPLAEHHSAEETRDLHRVLSALSEKLGD
jgi:hypothetical protein